MSIFRVPTPDSPIVRRRPLSVEEIDFELDAEAGSIDARRRLLARLLPATAAAVHDAYPHIWPLTEAGYRRLVRDLNAVARKVVGAHRNDVTWVARGGAA